MSRNLIMKYTYSILRIQLRGTPNLKKTGKQPSFQTVADD